MDIPSNDRNDRDTTQGVGPLFGIIIIVVLMAAGGIYFLILQEQNKTPVVPATEEQANS